MTLLWEVYLDGDLSFGLFSARQVLESEKSKSNFHPHSLMLQNYWIIRNNLGRRRSWLAVFLQKTNIPTLQLDGLDTQDLDHVFYRMLGHNQGQR